METKRQASHSDAQQEAGREAIRALGRSKGVELQPHRLQLADSVFQLDGYYRDSTQVILAEVYTHIGPIRAAQRHRVMADLLKLALLKRLLHASRPDHATVAVMVFLDEEATSVVRGKSWAALAAREFDIEIAVVPVATATIASVRAAQIRQDLRTER